MNRAVIVFLLLLVPAFTACNQQRPAATGVVVEVDSDLRAALASIDVAIYDASEGQAGGTHHFVLRPGLSLPFSFGVEPNAGRGFAFVAVATGKDSDGKVLAEAKASAAFIKGETLGPLTLFLSAACVSVVPCAKGTSCDVVADAGAVRCGEIPKPTLSRFRGAPSQSGARQDAGESASVRDAAPANTGAAGGGMADHGAGGRGAAGNGSNTGGNGGQAGSSGTVEDMGTAGTDGNASGGRGGNTQTASGGAGGGGQAGAGGSSGTTTEPGMPIAACIGKNAGDAVCAGTERKRCSADLSSLDPYACVTNAHCDAGGGTIVCTCDSGFMDDGASGCISYCAAMPCENGGVCTAGSSGRSCDCGAVDYEGTSCENRIDNCALTPCQNGGACMDGVRARSCDCTGTGFAGADCQTAANECNGSNVCTSDYPCIDLTPFYECRGQYADFKPSDSPASFMASGGMVTDTRSGLVWQQTPPATYTGCTGKTKVTGDSCTIAQGKSYCSSLGSGWRLPTKAELESIVDYTLVGPAINSSFFPNTPSDNYSYWTASPQAAPNPGTSGDQWYIDFIDGLSGGMTVTSDTGRVRCVR